MGQIISREEVDELIRIKGEVRGVAMKGDLTFLLQKKGKEALKMFEEETAKLGYPIKYNDLNMLSFYPIGLKGISLLVLKRVFDFDNKDFQEMGEFGAKLHTVIRIFMKYIFSPRIFSQQTQRMWNFYYSIGKCEGDLNEKDRLLALRVYDFPYFPEHCQVLIGYFSAIFRMVVKNEVTCRETKCNFRGDDYHEFILKWE